ncbi:hypothetical protein F5I97DRAFT_1852184 [Phlebopus sp. FC_14]|nr:hypothetical protein F5I97DRAFT_1852184 [Phlebopus sp. FC_14]
MTLAMIRASSSVSFKVNPNQHMFTLLHFSCLLIPTWAICPSLTSDSVPNVRGSHHFNADEGGRPDRTHYDQLFATARTAAAAFETTELYVIDQFPLSFIWCDPMWDSGSMARVRSKRTWPSDF